MYYFDILIDKIYPSPNMYVFEIISNNNKMSGDGILIYLAGVTCERGRSLYIFCLHTYFYLKFTLHLS